MYGNHVFNTMDDALPAMMRVLLRKGEENGSRNGTVKELMHTGITLCQPWRREITLDHRRPNIAAQIAETMWVLTGREDMDFLTKYLPRATDYSDDGERWRGAYGPRLRQWWSTPDAEPIDQWQHVLDLLQRDPLSRRAVAAIYDPVVDSEDGLDIPCNNWLNFSSRLGKLDLHVAIRSNDIMWGWSGINAFEWSAMLEISAAILGVQTGSLHFSTTSLHLYAPHWAKGEKVAVDQPWLGEPLQDSPRYTPNVRSLAYFDELADAWFQVESMIRRYPGSSGTTKEIDDFPEPMLQSWLRVIHWWWTGDHTYLKPLAGTRLEYATHVAMQPKRDREVVVPIPGGGKVQSLVGAAGRAVFQAPVHQTSDFIQFAIKTHDEKHAAYGNSWKKRGEMLGIMANIARKVDRLGGADTSDESSADTAMDLMVYLAKYRVWLGDQNNPSFDDDPSDGTLAANELLLRTEERVARDNGQPTASRGNEEQWLREKFDDLERAVMGGHRREAMVDDMLATAYALARRLWDEQPVADPECSGQCRPVLHGEDPDCPVHGDQYRGADVD